MSGRKFWMRWRVRTGYAVAFAYWLLARPTPRSIIYGGATAIVGLIIRAAASGHLRKDRELATSGPYALTRNPLYFGSAFLAAGFIVAGNSWPAGVLVALYFGIFYYAVMRNEESDLRARFGTAFNEYCARVPLFIPRLTGAPGAGPAGSGGSAVNFSWSQYKRNREYQALIGTVVALGTLVLRMWIRSRWGY